MSDEITTLEDLKDAVGMATGCPTHLFTERREEQWNLGGLDVDLPVDLEHLAFEACVFPTEDLAKDLEILRGVSNQPLEGQPEILRDDRGMSRAETEPQSPPRRGLSRERLHGHHERMAGVGR